MAMTMSLRGDSESNPGFNSLLCRAAPPTGCGWCKPGSSHYCRVCETPDVDHRSEVCPHRRCRVLSCTRCPNKGSTHHCEVCRGLGLDGWDDVDHHQVDCPHSSRIAARSGSGGEETTAPRHAAPTSPLFDEWLALAFAAPEDGSDRDVDLARARASLVDASVAERVEFGPNDALVVIDMQCDFVPCDKISNPNGGKFGVAEGELIVAPIAAMISAAAAAGASVIASRDYHPIDHASFTVFPSHCVQGTRGAEFMSPIARALEDGMAVEGREKIQIVFKAFHENVDSFGALPYAASPHGAQRLTGTVASGSIASEGACMGCAAAPWTGSVALKSSALCVPCAGEPSEWNANAPPDVLATLTNDGIDRGMKTLFEILEGKDRIYVCGLALDFCVLDTCTNAKALGFEHVAMIVDLARAAHIAGRGQYGSGFLSDPKALVNGLLSAGVDMVSAVSLVPEELIWSASNAPGSEVAAVHKPFPQELGSFTLATIRPSRCPGVTIDFDATPATYCLPLPSEWNTDRVAFGLISPLGPLPPNGWEEAKVNGATHIVWAYPSVHDDRDADGGWVEMTPTTPTTPSGAGGADDAAAGDASAAAAGATTLRSVSCVSDFAFLAVTRSALQRFALYGGFILLDEDREVVGLQPIIQEPKKRTPVSSTTTDSDSGATVSPPSLRKVSHLCHTLGAARWQDPDGVITAKLRSQGRFQRVTVPRLLRASEFCWIYPNEDVGKLAGVASWKPSKTGAFVYLFSEDSRLTARFFPLA